MSNISVKLNLTQMKHARREMSGKDGKKIDCLIIPIDENGLIKGEKGVYFNITAIEIKDRSNFKPDQKDTHLLKQSFPTEVYSQMSDEQKNAQPILGNAIDWGKVAPSEPRPQQSDSLSDSAVDNYNDNKEEHDDLPF
jgi:hypothetical protein